jgi:transposase
VVNWDGAFNDNERPKGLLCDRGGFRVSSSADKLCAAYSPKLEVVLERAVAANIDGLSGSCADMLEHRQALWTFVDNADVEPTNNHAEREIRAFVLWRKRSYGTQSDRGNVFAERVMTVAHTARKQNKNVLAFLTACCRARAGSGSWPSLFVPDAAVAAQA